LDLGKNVERSVVRKSNKCVCSRKSEGRKQHVEYNLATTTRMAGRCA